MKILFFIDKLYGGGAERVATILMNHLCKKNNVSVFIFNDSKAPYPMDDRINIQKITINNKYKISRFLKRIKNINEEIKKNSPDLIISFLTPTNIYVLIANLFLRKKIIISERNTLNRIQSRIVRLIRRILYPLADKIVFVTKADNIKFGLPQKSITIYNPTIFEPFTDYNHRENSIITIAPINRWYNKGLDLLIKAWGLISRQNPNWNLEILGNNDDCPIPNDFKKQERIVWLGWKNNVCETLRTKSIFVLASRYEGCPNSLIEAMSQGCACLGTNCEGGINEIITDGTSGLLVRNGNVNDLATKLQLLIDNKQLRKKLSAGAIEEIKRFNKENIMKQWDELIEMVTQVK